MSSYKDALLTASANVPGVNDLIPFMPDADKQNPLIHYDTRLQEQVYLTPPYAALTEYYAQQITRSKEQSSATNSHSVPSVVGIAVMARYASIIPLVYIGYRHRFPGKPETVSAQALEVGKIASRSLLPITTMAEHAMPISGALERIYMLRGGRDDMFHRLRDFLDRYWLVGATDGFRIDTTKDMTEIAEYKKDEYVRSHDGKPVPRAVGCLALHIKDEQGMSAFESLWQSMICKMTRDPAFFQHDLQDMYDALDEYMLDTRYLDNIARKPQLH